MSEPAYSRLDVDERRRQLLDLGADLFTQHAYDELSMAAIARAAGISKALLYHYFPSKQAYFQATLADKIDELAASTEPDPSKPPLEQLRGSIEAYLDWVQANAQAYARLLRSAGSAPEFRDMVEGVRARTAQRILAGLAGTDGPPPPRARAAMRGWLLFMDGVCLDWIAHQDLDRDAVRDLLLSTLIAALAE